MICFVVAWTGTRGKGWDDFEGVPCHMSERVGHVQRIEKVFWQAQEGKSWL